MARTTGPSTNAPRCRTAGTRIAKTRNETTATSTIAVPNSYMLPQGSRPVASPRVTSTPTWVSAPSTATDTAIWPQRRLCAGSASSGDSGTAGAPAPAPTSSGVRAGRRPKASRAQNARTATEYSATLIENNRSDSAASDGSGVTRGDLRFRCAGSERGVQVVCESGEPRPALAAAPGERGDRQHGTAAVGGGGDPGEHPLPAEEQHAEQAEEQRDRRAEHPVLARVVGELEGRELLEAGEADPRAVGQRHRLPHRQVGGADLAQLAAGDRRGVQRV